MFEPGIMNAAELMDRVFDVYKKSFVKQLAFSALVGVVSFTLMLVMGIVAGVAVMMPFIDNPESAVTFMFLAMLAVMLPVYFIWTAAADAGHILLSQQAFYGMSVRLPARRLPKVTLRVMGAMLAEVILALPWLALMGLLLFLFLRPASVDIINDPYRLLYTVTSASNAWIALGIVGTVVYGVYSNIFSLAIPCAVFERRTFFNAVVRSWRLIKGSFWKILGLRLLWGIAVYLFSYSAQGLWALIMELVNGITGSTLGYSPLLGIWGSLFQMLFTIAAGFLAGPLSGIFTALLYFNQRIKKEGLDIEIMLDRLKAAP